ncbi:MAG: dihydrophenazinedicarboxylate synthase [Solirubrobacterales bacterium]|nr:dihydrophenazinedicarboxylate synthase [Solirubrobacterales bacterium]
MSEPLETLSGDPTLELPELDSPPDDPLPLLERWLAAAEERGVREPRALALATADAEGRPSSRILLLKQVSPALVFAGSYESRKGRELAANPRAAGTLYWRETLQQVTVEGPVRRLSEEESDEIFGERPADAQATTVASRQGEPLENPAELRRAADELSSQNGPLQRPPRWGGYRLDPDLVEFWHGSPDRLHRRLLYVKSDGAWTHRRLQP